MIKVILTKGAPSSGKSTWTKSEIDKDPLNWLRINNDDLRQSFNNTNFSSDYEQIIRNTRLFLLKEGIKQNKNIIVDNVNAKKDHWEEVVKICEKANKDILLTEQCFYQDLSTLFERNSKREGIARVPDEVVKKFWKQLGGEQFKSYIPQEQKFYKRTKAVDKFIEPMQQDEKLSKAIIIDLDGTLAFIGDRSPYDASMCDIVDKVNPSVIETIKLYYDANYEIIFCSGREDKDEAPTRRFINKHFFGKYELFMRKTGDKRSDDIIKEEIFNSHIKDKWNIKLVLDDRLRVCRLWYSMGLNLFRVGDPDADF